MTETVSVQMCFDSYFNLSKLCSDDGMYWLSWNVQDKTYKSDEFSNHDNGPPMLKIIVKFDVKSKREPTTLIPREVIDTFPITVLLCTHHAVLGVARVNPFKVESVDKENITSTMPFELSEWVQIMPFGGSSAGSDRFQQGQTASMKVSLIISSNKSQHDDESYDGETFENEETEYFSEERIEQHSRQRVHYKTEILEGIARKVEQHNAKVEDDRALHHYRLSVDMRTIGGLKRPATMSLHYVYPYLGSGIPVRTKHVYVPPNSEIKVDNGAATFECAMSREQLLSTLVDHPLKITALTRTHLGNDILGELTVDLSAVYAKTDVHSYRCPVTNRVFKELSHYNHHREVLHSLKAAGRVEHAPPKDPVIIKALDQIFVFTAPRPESRAAKFAEGMSKTNPESGKPTPNYITPLAEGGKLRIVMILEDLGVVSGEMAINVKPGYKMHNGAVYDRYGSHMGVEDVYSLGQDSTGDEAVDVTLQRLTEDPLQRGTVGVGEDARPLTPLERRTLEKLKLDWEAWRRATDVQWREAYAEKEALMLKAVEEKAAAKLADRAKDLERAQFEAGKLEVRLRAAIQEVERQKNQMELERKAGDVKIAQRTSELQLIQRRVRDEAKSAIAEEHRRAESLKHQATSLEEALKLMERRAKDSERDFEQYRAQLRNSPESVLREEAAKLRAQLGECRGEVERERRLRTEVELEKEHFRAQMHRLALALKREREKSSVMARQELEQLRLEFLAREERLDCG